MRKESTIRARVAKLHASKYRQHYRTEIATLEWVLGEVESVRQRCFELMKEDFNVQDRKRIDQ